MAHGTPDWGLTAGTITTFQLTDLAELAARLGSIVTFDRRGEAVLLESFEDGLSRWDKLLGGTLAAVDLSTARTAHGAFSLRLTAGSNDTHLASISRSLGPAALALYGLELVFSLASHVQALEWLINVYDGVHASWYVVRWREDTDTLEYDDSTGNPVTFATNVRLLSGPTTFHSGKLVVDGANREYVRFLLNASAYDLSGIAARAIASSVAPRLEVGACHIGAVPWNAQLWLDSVIVTQNEPA
jgi:hypothetical protein